MFWIFQFKTDLQDTPFVQISSVRKINVNKKCEQNTLELQRAYLLIIEWSARIWKVPSLGSDYLHVTFVIKRNHQKYYMKVTNQSQELTEQR